MGLDITVVEEKDIHHFRAGSYSGFGAFREWLAALVGIDLNSKEGFEGTESFDEREPFRELLNHSDCDGELTHYDCVELLEDFNEWATKLPAKTEENEHLLESYESWHYAVGLGAAQQYRKIIFH